MKVLVVGAGTMGHVHTRSYLQMEKVDLIGIVDASQEAGKSLASDAGVQYFQNVEEAIATEPAIDVIDICLPTFLHKEYVLKAAVYVSSVICEKPLSISLGDAREIIEACKKKGVRLFVGHVVRFFPEYQRVKQIIEQGEIGTPAIVRTSRGGPFPRAWKNWYGDPEKSGGLMLDLLIHDFDFVRYCFGEVTRIYSESLSKKDLHDYQIDYSLVTLRFKSGVIAHLEGTWARDQFSTSIEVSGDKGIIEYDSAKISPVKLFRRETADHTQGVSVPESPLKQDPYLLELTHFLKCIADGSQPIVTPEDGYEAMRLVFAAKKSSECGEPVFLD